MDSAGKIYSNKKWNQAMCPLLKVWVMCLTSMSILIQARSCRISSLAWILSLAGDSITIIAYYLLIYCDVFW